MNYINTTTLVASDLNTLRYQHQNMSIPDGADLTDIGYAKIQPNPPVYDAQTQITTPLPPIEVEGGWTEQWEVTEKPLFIPKTVTRFQALAALHLAGMLDSAEAAVAQGDFLTKLAWANAQTFERNSPTLAALSGALGITSEQLDTLFITAAGLTA